MNTENMLSNFCTDILTLSENEWFLKYLFRKKNGKWIRVTDIFKSAGKFVPEVSVSIAELFATWLEHPFKEPDYVLVLFYDTDTGWDMSASYNRMRLIGLGE